MDYRPERDANRMDSPTIKIDANDLRQYCHYNGEDTMVIVLDAVMDRDVDGDALGEAVRQAEKRFSSFGCGLASVGRGLCYRPLATPARAYENVPGKRWLLGTDDTDGRLYRVTYAGPRITVSLHHGLTDGRGAFEYLKALICFYLAELGYSVDHEGKVLVAGDVPANEDEYPCSKYGELNDKGGASAPPAAKLFGIEEDYLDEHGDYRCRHVEITAPAASVVSAARKAGVTVTSLLVAVADRAIAQAYCPNEELVLSCITTDCRPLFDSATLQNFSGIAILAEVPQMRSMPIEAEAQALGQQLVGAHNQDAALGRIGERLAEVACLEATPVDELFGNEETCMAEKRNVRKSLACLVTNVGIVNLPKDALQHVRQACFRIPSFSATMSLAVATCGDTLTINVTQPFVSEGFSRAIVSTLTQLGITARACDRGLEAYDILKRNAVADLS